jgi:hypothetical protein
MIRCWLTCLQAHGKAGRRSKADTAGGDTPLAFPISSQLEGDLQISFQLYVQLERQGQNKERSGYGHAPCHEAPNTICMRFRSDGGCLPAVKCSRNADDTDCITHPFDTVSLRLEESFYSLCERCNVWRYADKKFTGELQERNINS